MTRLLDTAFKEVAKLPAATQEALGTRILDELELLKDETRWRASFARTGDALSRWADEVLSAPKPGKAAPLDFRRRAR